ncbi:MAG: hypothetical protein PHD72_04485 [Patescibacteria group bacterium]|nr:hypothetical protein [Patescibacteria group bacterium]
MNEERDINYLIVAKQKSLEGQKSALNPREKDYKKKIKIIEDKIRRIPFELGLNNKDE